MVFYATDEPIFFLRFCADYHLCACARAQNSFWGQHRDISGR